MNYLSTINFQHMITRGAKHLISYEKDLNAINVFPVPDGDTGSNLAFLMNMILLKQPHHYSHSQLEQLKLACLQGSRGNSGMIFSQFIIAMCDFLKDKEQLSHEQFVEMCEFSVNKTYQAVHTPMEGTILTVMRDWVSSLNHYKQKVASIPELLSHAMEAALTSLEQTKILREECRRQNVVDAGAKGFCYFLHGFIEGLTAKHDAKLELAATAAEDFHVDAFSVHEVVEEDFKYRYCTEFIVTDVTDEQRLKTKLSAFGDSLVFIGSQSYCKLHIHTDKPYEITEILQAEGKIMFQKVEDMHRQQQMLMKKHKIAIVVDSACDLPQHFMDEYHIHLIPLSIMVNGSHYLDKQTITANQLYRLMKNDDTTVQTSLPNREQITRLYNQLSANYEHVFSIHVSSKLSGTYAACKTIAKEMANHNIHVIDSKTLSGSYGLVIKQFAEYIKENTHSPIDRLMHHINLLRYHNKIFVTVPSLRSMVNSGRVSKTVGKLAQLFSLKPIVTLDSDGKSKLLSPTVFKKSNLPQLMKQVKKLHLQTPIKEYALLYTDEETELAMIEKSMVKLTGFKPVYTTTVSTVIGKYAGSGAYSVAIISDSERMDT